jgi:uncharacterized protein YwbE
MEKDNFNNRSYAYEYNNLLKIGDIVYICEKHMQKVATNLEHLTKGEIIQKLTSSINHPRGIKVKIKVDKSFKTLAGEKDYAIGRVVYLVDKETNEILFCDRS